MSYEGQNEEMMFIHGKPVQVGSFDMYHYCMPDLRYFEMADVLVIELSFACIIVKNTGMRGEEKKYRIVNGERIPVSELDFVTASVDTCDLTMPVDSKYQNAAILFDGRERERLLFGHVNFEQNEESFFGSF